MLSDSRFPIPYANVATSFQDETGLLGLDSCAVGLEHEHERED